jgi:hypothetical protein
MIRKTSAAKALVNAELNACISASLTDHAAESLVHWQNAKISIICAEQNEGSESANVLAVLIDAAIRRRPCFLPDMQGGSNGSPPWRRYEISDLKTLKAKPAGSALRCST